MITLDSRVGSKELLPYLPKAKAQLGRLEYGDACWIGNGPEGVPVTVGVERKRLHDLLSSMTTGRFAGTQLPGLQASYQIIYLVVEGIWRPNPRSGVLETASGKRWVPVEHGSRRFMAREIEGWLSTQEILGRVRIRKTSTPRETAQLLLTLHHWWTDKTWEEHRSHMTFDESDGLPYAMVVKPSLEQRVAKEFPGVGWGRSRDMAERFESVYAMVNASEEELMSVPGIDKVLGPKIWKALRGGS